MVTSLNVNKFGPKCEHSNVHKLNLCLSNIENINLRSTKLTNRQCSEIFKVSKGDSKLKVLNIGNNDLMSVETDTLAKTVNKVEECNLYSCKMSVHQLEAIFKLLNEDCKLKILNMSGVTLSLVEVDVISKAIANLEEVDLRDTDLTTEQLEAIFMEIKSRRKLKNLILCAEDLRSVQIDSLVEALRCLEGVNLDEAWLTPEQWAAVSNIPEDCMPKAL